jgi:hypothetical protein
VTDRDVATRLISLEDDPTMPAFTFRMFFLGLGLSCFGAVLGQIFVSISFGGQAFAPTLLIPLFQYFRPQTVYVSQLFLQIIAYILGICLETIIPGPGHPVEKFRMNDSAFWRFMNPGPFSTLHQTSC